VFSFASSDGRNHTETLLFLTSVTGALVRPNAKIREHWQEAFVRQRAVVVVLSLVLSSAGLWAKNATQETPQTARQALLEMFFSKQPGTLLKHLPTATRAALEKSSAMAGLQQYSMLAGQLHTQEQNLQTFEAGPVLLATEDFKTGQKFEVIVDNDSLRGDQDDIELSFHSYKDKQLQRTPFMPRIVFSMKMEAGNWTLNDIAITINLPLADPDFLKSISDKMKPSAAAISPPIHVQGIGQVAGQIPGQITARTPGSDTSALADLRKILTAETIYFAAYPTVGYTCSLSDLDGFGAAEPNEHQAMLISSGLASGKHQGYSFSLSSCAGTPAVSFRLSATPIGDASGRRAFCTDQSASIRASTDGNAATCLSSGTPVR